MMGSRRGPLGVCGAVVICLALATAAHAQEAADSFADGDVVKITAFGRDDLTGQYSVQPGPLLSLPLIGTVPLANRNPRQLETELATAWENRLGTPMSVTVEFTQRAPFYVIGAVNTPGAYPYRSGLTVLQAVAVGGGILKQAGLSDNLRVDLIRERERRTQALEKLAEAVARRARLIAERDGKSDVTLDAPFSLVPKERMDALLAAEAKLLDIRAKQASIKEGLLSDQIRLGEAEIASYQQQFSQLKGQQDDLTREANRIKRIPGQQVRAFELDQRATMIETTKSSVAASIARAKIDVETARNGIADLHEATSREITEALLETEQAIRENEVIEAAARDVIEAAGGNAGSDALSFHLIRAGKQDVADVQSTTVLEPGDLLEVSMAPPPAVAQAASAQK